MTPPSATPSTRPQGHTNLRPHSPEIDQLGKSGTFRTHPVEPTRLQGTQNALPLLGWENPLGHGRQLPELNCAICSLYVPAAQFTHPFSEVSPSPMPYFPDKHGLQTLALFAARSLDQYPRGHAWHCDTAVFPSNSLYMPAGQARHEPVASAPVSCV